MAMRTDSMPVRPKDEELIKAKEAPIGETRLDHEGKGYFHVFNKNRPEEIEKIIETPKKKKKKKRR